VVEVVGSMPSSLVQKMELLLLLPSAAAQVDESESMVYLLWIWIPMLLTLLSTD
jgi:hypothetical protein